MAGLEAVGALVAASQLVEQGLRLVGFLSQLYKNVRDAPETIGNQSVQVKQLIDISRLIEQNPTLQSDKVAAILHGCNDEAENLVQILGKIISSDQDGKIEKLWKALDGVSKEKQILSSFSKLEWHKSLLTLCIAEIDSQALHTIHLELGTAQTSIDGISKEVVEIRDNLRGVETIVNILPGAFGDIADIHKQSEMLPNIAALVSTVSGEMPAMSGKITAIHDDLLPVIRDILEKLMINQSGDVGSRQADSTTGHFLVPFARNLQFVSRNHIMEKLTTKLEAGKGHNRVALVGLGGIGKSQIALEYAYGLHERSPEVSIYWVHASSASRFEQDYLHIGKAAGLPGLDDPSLDVKKLVRDWLISKESASWLMIVDNADDAGIFFGAKSSGSTRLSDFLPPSLYGSIIFTTRNKKAGVKFAGASGVVELPKLNPDEGVRLLSERIGEDISDQHNVLDFLELLDFLPLAISQAGSYMAENLITIPEYLELYNDSEASKIELLSEDFEDLARDSEIRNPVAATWLISFEQIKLSDKTAAELLSFMACLDRLAISKDLLPRGESAVKLTSALGLLKAYSLISSDSSNLKFDMHRLVYLATRNWMRLEGQFDHWAEECLRVVLVEFPSGNYEDFDKCALYLPHAQIVLGYEQLSPKYDKERAGLAINMSNYFRRRSDFSAAETLARKSTELRRNAFGEEAPLFLNTLRYLGDVQRSQGRYDEAEELTRAAVAGLANVLGEEHEDALTAMANLGSILWDKGELAEAEDLQQGVLRARERTLGEDNEDTLFSLNDVATMLIDQGKYAEAEAMLGRALAGFERSAGKDHPNTLGVLQNLALLYWRQADYEKAEELTRQALGVIEKMFGGEHLNTLVALNTLSNSLRGQGKYDQAEAMSQRAVLGIEKCLGKEHPGTLTARSGLARNLWHQGRYKEAEQIDREVLAAREKVLGPNHTDTLESANNLALSLKSRGLYDEAEVLIWRAYDGLRKIHGEEHPDTLVMLDSYAMLLVASSKHGEAEEMVRKSLAAKEKVFGADHPETLLAMNNLGFALQHQRKYEEAEESFRQAVNGFEKVHGEEHPDTLTSVGNLGLVLLEQDKCEMAEPFFARALAGEKKALGPDHPTTLLTLGNVASLYDKQKRYDEAAEAYEKVLAVYRKMPEKVVGGNDVTVAHNYKVMLEEMAKERQRPVGFR